MKDFKITRGDTLISLEGFNDGIITINVSFDNAVKGDSVCVQYV